MKKYIKPTTQMMAIVYGTSLMISMGNGEDPTRADSPQRQFTGDSYSSLKYLI